MLFLGSTIGLTFGAMPGLGTIVALSVVLPFTFGMDPMLAMFLYAGIESSTALGASIPAILLNTPGMTQSVCTALDGFPLAKKGEGARAIGISAASCGVGSVVGVVLAMALIPVLRPIVLAFGSPEFFWLIVLGLVAIAFVASENMVKGLVSGGLGFLLAMVGFSPVHGVTRYTFGSTTLWDGLGLVPVFVGMFALSEAIKYGALGRPIAGSASDSVQVTNWWGQVWQGTWDVVSRPWEALRGSVVGTIVGIIPGLGGNIASFMSYTLAVRLSKHPETFGTGEVEGIIAAETANDAKDGGALLPTVAFGVPGSPEHAVLLGAFILHGLQPGPFLLRDHISIVYALLFGIAFGQLIATVLGLTLAVWLSRLTTISTHYVAPLVAVMVFIGSYAVRENIWDMVLALIAGIAGFCMKRYGFPIITLSLGFVLGVLAEQSFHTSLKSAYGSYTIFFSGPISIVLILFLIATLVAPFIRGRAMGQKAHPKIPRD